MITILDTSLMAERLKTKMIEKGYVHKNGNPHQKILAIAMGDTKYQPVLSSVLRKEQRSITEEILTKIAKTLNVQEQWLIGGEYVPLQERPLFEDKYIPEEVNEPEKAENELLCTLGKISDALYMIMRQLQKMNKEEEKNG